MQNTDSVIIEFDLSRKIAHEIAVNDLPSSLLDETKIYWIHCDLTDTDFLQKISTHLNLSERLIEIIHDDNPMPKLLESDESLTIKLQVPLEPTAEKKLVMTSSSLMLYLTNHYCLSISTGPTPTIKDFLANYQKSLRYAQTPCFILFVILDNMINDFSNLLFMFEARAEKIDSTLRGYRQSNYARVMGLKKELMKTKRLISSLRDILMRISGRKFNVVSEQCRKSLQDLYNHSHTLVNEADSVRELLHSILDQIENTLMHTLSKTMQFLTAVATMLMPPTLIASIYGMNFHLPEYEWKYGYAYGLTLIVVSMLVVFLVFKRNKWF